MILSDNETKLDLLNNRAIAKTIVSVINESTESISIGVHGDWGVGKSSVLAMAEELLSPKATENTGGSEEDEDEELDFDALIKLEESVPDDGMGDEEDIPAEGVLTVKFNSWQYQGFEDAKIALMSAIVKALEKKAKQYYKNHPIKNAAKKLKEICKRIWGNIDRLSVAKTAGKAAFAVATGVGKAAVIKSGIEAVKDIVTDNDKRDDFIELVGNLLKGDSAQDTSCKEMDDFRSNYSDLFKAAHVKKLVVLIDDLDRCLPKVAIETLEAVRMFLSMENTAFIIAADDAMIRYSVKEHFPRISTQSDEELGNSKAGIKNQFENKYLEKLIQVPFHVPRVGEKEARIYIMLLMIESATGESKGLKALAKRAIEKLGRPWLLEQFSTEEIKEVMGDEYNNSVIQNVKIAKSIEELLAKNTDGNPRNIKRFVNMLLLRAQVAYNRGFKDSELKISVLAKMMLAEQYLNDFYKALFEELQEDGSCPLFDTHEKETGVAKELEEQNETQPKDNSEEKEENKKRGTAKTDKSKSKGEDGNTVKKKNSELQKHLDMEDVKAWMKTEPSLEGEDLRPYYFACKEKEDLFFNTQDERLREMIAVVKGGKMNVNRKKGEIESLSPTDAKTIFKVVTQGIFIQNLSETKIPQSIEGVRAYVQIRTELQESLADFLLTLPPEDLGMWSVSGWNESIPKTSTAYPKLLQFVRGISEKNKTKLIRDAAKNSI